MKKSMSSLPQITGLPDPGDSRRVRLHSVDGAAAPAPVSSAEEDRRRLKIAMIGGRGVANTYSGIETYYEEVGSRLAARGHEVVVYCRTHFTPAMESYRGIRVHRLPSLKTKHLDTLVHTILSTVDAVPRGFDIIHYHALGPSLFALLPRLFGRATVASVHGLDWQRGKWGRVARTALRACEWASARCPTSTIVVSRTLQRHYLEVQGRTTEFVPNAVLPSPARPPERILARGLQKDGYLLFAGRLSPEKGVHTLLEALRPLRGRKKLVIAGGSSFADTYVQSLHAAAWEDVVFLGNVDRQTMEELYSNCYAFVLPSVMEGLSVALLEALAFGACIITTDIPENLEVVGTAALTFPPGDVSALRLALEQILDSRVVVEAYRQRAREHAGVQPDWEEVARLTEAVYYRCLDGAAPEYPATGVPPCRD